MKGNKFGKKGIWYYNGKINTIVGVVFSVVVLSLMGYYTYKGKVEFSNKENYFVVQAKIVNYYIVTREKDFLVQYIHPLHGKMEKIRIQRVKLSGYYPDIGDCLLLKIHKRNKSRYQIIKTKGIIECQN